MQWHTPIGYVVRDGNIIIEETQVKTVRRIFEEYISGKSAFQIAKMMTDEGVTNGKGRISWSHASVGTVLENHSYLGTEYYPQIIEKELFEQVQIRREQVRQARGKGKYRPGRNTVLLYSGILVCGECGSIYSHFQPPKERKNAQAKWKCKNYIFKNHLGCSGGFITDEEVERVSIWAINQVLLDHNLAQRYKKAPQPVCPEYRLLNRTVEQMEEKENTDCQELLMARAAARYKTLEVRDEAIFSVEMMDIIQEKEEISVLDPELLQGLVKHIVVNKDHTVDVVYRNHNSIKIQYR